MSASKKRPSAGACFWRRILFSCTALALAIFLLDPVGHGFAQAYTASLTGIISDPQGAVMPHVSVVLRNMDTGGTRVTTTEADGRYTFAQLLPATYELTATFQGFKTYVRSNLILLAERASDLSFTMQLGATQTAVEVTAPTVVLDTQSATQSATLTSTMVTELPLDVRNPLALVLTQAAATQGIFGPLNGAGAGNFDQTYSGFTLKGSRSMGSLILLDGAPDTAADWGGLLVAPSTESVTEMQIIDNTYDAQFGKTEGGVVSMVTKSGTASFRGEAYDFLRNDNLDANSWSNNTFGAPRPEFKRNQFGANVGGPMWRSKHLYFFGAYEGLRQPFASSSGTETVPTLAQRQGDFSATYNTDKTLAVLYNPFSTQPDPNNPGQYLRQPFDASCVGVVYPNTCPGNAIPQGMMDPVAQKVVALFPKPNLPGDPITAQANYFAVASGLTLTDRIDARVDWAHSERHSMYVRWSQRLRQNNNTPDFYGNGAENADFKSDKNPGYHGVWANTFTPTSSWVVNVLVASGRWNESQISPALGRLTPPSVGLPASEFQAALLPHFSFGGYQDLGDSQIRNFIRYENNLQVNATKEKGAHGIKFGFMGEAALVNNIDRESGNFSFGRGMTSGPIAATDSATTGNGLASFLLGTGVGGSADLNPDLATSMRYFGFYGQDTWHATNKLTLIYGLRYEVQPGATERFNRWSIFDPNVTNPLTSANLTNPLTRMPLALKGGFVYASSGNRGLWPTDRHNFAPRLGFAYRITDRLVMRGGFGIFTMPASALISFDSPGQSEGFSTSTSWVSSVSGAGFIPQDLIDNPFPDGLNQPTGKAGGVGTATGQSLGQVWLKAPHPTGYQQNASLGFQYELGPGRVIEVGYAGFRARKLVYGNPSLNMDQLPDGYLSMGNALLAQVPNPFYNLFKSSDLSKNPTVQASTFLLPFPEYTDVEPARSLPGARANFDSLGVGFTQQFKGGLTVISTYQWSKTLDDASEDQGWSIWNGQWRDYYNRKLEYSVSSHDVPQSLVTSLVYELPVGHGKMFGSNFPGAANAALGGWQFSTVVSLHSGLPMIIGAPGNSLQNLGFGKAAPDLVSTKNLHVLAAPVVPTPSGGLQWFNACTSLPDGTLFDCAGNQPVAWALPGPFEVGNAPRYISNLRSDWTKNMDVSLAKYFQLTERFRLQFRSDFLNTWNTPVFSGQDGFVTSGTFGQVFGTANSPRNIQFALKLLF